MEPGPARKLTDSTPFTNRSLALHGLGADSILEVDGAASTSLEATRIHDIANHAPTSGEATTLASTPGPAYHLDPEKAREYMKNIRRFRILVMGRANAGKTTLLQRVCNTVENPEIFDGKGNKVDSTDVQGTLRHGHHDIENELVFRSNPGFVFHDSCGFEAGSAEQFERMKNFVVECAAATSLKQHIHAIWFCIPMTDYHRTVTAAEQKFFNECDTGHVPVIVLLTKADALNLPAIEDLLDSGLEIDEAQEKAEEKERELLAKLLSHIKGMLAECKFPPSAYLAVQKMHEETADCTMVMQCTTNTLNEEGLQRLLISTQQSSITLCIEYAVQKTLKSKMELAVLHRLWVSVKGLEKDLLSWFPNIVDQAQQARQYWWQRQWNYPNYHVWERGEHLLELSSLAVVNEYSRMPSLPQNVTFLGRFLTVQSMAHHAVACLLVFEHSYYLMLQGNYVWEEALAFSVEKYKNSQVQETIFQALKVAFQQHGNNLEDLCDTIVKIIRENKMSL